MSQSAYNERTRELLIKQYRSYPNMKEDDVFKYIFQSSFGCEHLVSDEDAAIKYIMRDIIPMISESNTILLTVWLITDMQIFCLFLLK